MNAAISAYNKGRALLKELHVKLRASNNQQEYLLKLIGIFQKVRDEKLTELANLMESKL